MSVSLGNHFLARGGEEQGKTVIKLQSLLIASFEKQQFIESPSWFGEFPLCALSTIMSFFLRMILSVKCEIMAFHSYRFPQSLA